LWFFAFFFFQAEDGIRDFHVTGVQTCALPIWLGFNGADELEFYMFRGTGEWLGQLARFEALGDFSADPLKIEDAKKGERRVYRQIGRASCRERVEISGGGVSSRREKRMNTSGV